MTTMKHLVAIVLGVTDHDHVIKFHQGKVSCDCMAWRFHGRKCQHLDHFRKHYTDDTAKMLSIGSKVAIMEAYHMPEIVTKDDIRERFPGMFKDDAEEAKVHQAVAKFFQEDLPNAGNV